MAKINITTCIEITDFHIKLIQVNSLRPSPSLLACAIKEITQQDDAALSKTLSAMVAAAKIKPGLTVGIIPRRFAILRSLSLPSHNDEEIKKMINLQVAKQIPYPKEDVILNHVILKKEPSGYAKILVMAVHKEVVGRYLKIFQDAGLTAQKLTLSSLGLLRWHNFEEEVTRKKSSRPTALINIDPQTTEVCFCHDQNLLFSRSIGFGAKDLNNEGLTAFLEEISLTLTTYHKENIAEDVSRIVILTNLPEAALLQGRLTSEYKVSVDIVRPLGNIQAAKELKLPLLEQSGVSVAAATGLLLGDVKKLADFLPSEVSNTRQVRQKRREVLKFAGLCVLAGIFGMSVFGMRFFKGSQYLANIKAKTEETSREVSSIEEKMRHIEFMKERLRPQTTSIDVIRELYNLTPQEVSFSVLFLDEQGMLTLQGVSETGAGVNVFQNNLVGSSLFQDVALQYVTKRKVFKGELTDFKITCRVAEK